MAVKAVFRADRADPDIRVESRRGGRAVLVKAAEVAAAEEDEMAEGFLNRHRSLAALAGGDCLAIAGAVHEIVAFRTCGAGGVFGEGKAGAQGEEASVHVARGGAEGIEQQVALGDGERQAALEGGEDGTTIDEMQSERHGRRGTVDQRENLVTPVMELVAPKRIGEQPDLAGGLRRECNGQAVVVHCPAVGR